MAGMFKSSFGEAFVVVNYTIADKLYLRNAGDSFKIGVKDGLSRAASLVVSVTIDLRLRIERLIIIGWIGITHELEDHNQTFVRAYC